VLRCRSRQENELRIEDLSLDPSHVPFAGRTCDKVWHSVAKAPEKKER